MPQKTVIKHALINSILSAIYIGLIANLMSYAEKNFSGPDTSLSAMAFLLTFVISAAIMALLIFGRPVTWYLDNHKKQAVQLAAYTIAFLIIIAVIIFVVLSFLPRTQLY